MGDPRWSSEGAARICNANQSSVQLEERKRGVLYFSLVRNAIKGRWVWRVRWFPRRGEETGREARDGEEGGMGRARKGRKNGREEDEQRRMDGMQRGVKRRREQI